MTRNGFLVIVVSFLCIGCGEKHMPQDEFFRVFGKSPQKLSSTQVVSPAAANGGRGELKKFIRVDVPDGLAIPININIRSEYAISGPIVSPDGHTTGAAVAGGVRQIGGPLVARVRWGVGGAYQVIDFDIPRARTPEGFGYPIAQNQIDDLGSGVGLCVSGSSFEVQVRHDGQVLPVSQLGTTIGNTLDAKVLVFLSPGTGANVGPIRRTISVATAGLGAVAAGATFTIGVPSFARSATFMRSPIDTTPLGIVTNDNGGNTIQQLTIPAGSEGTMPMTGYETIMSITNNGAVAIQNFSISFDVNPS